MIAKGTTHDNGGKLATYMVVAKPGERAELWQLRGFASDNIKDAFRPVHVMAAATRCEQPLFHTYVRNPQGEHLTREQWERVADRIESKLGLSSQPRAIAFHQDGASGHEHMHIGWSRIDDETMTAKPLPFFKLRLKEASRELEAELGLTPVRNEREGPVMAPQRDEDEQARRLGVDIREIRATIRECWERSDNGHSFAAALANEGLALAKGDKRDFMAIDRQGGMHALGKRILGNTAGEVRARMADLDREQLPKVDQAREQITSRREMVPETLTHAGGPAWKAAIAKAANENTGRGLAAWEAPAPPAARLEHELDESTTEICRAFHAARNAADFTAALDRNGIRLAVVTAKEAEHSGMYRAGEIVAVNQSGQIYQLDQPTTGTSHTEVEKFLASVNHRELCGIEATQEQIHFETQRHIALTQIGALPALQTKEEFQAYKDAADDLQPDWRRILTDHVYRRQVEEKDRERLAQENAREGSGPRSREPDRY